MIPSKDIYTSAQLIIEKCEGHYDPVQYASYRAKTLADEGDDEEAAVWRKIVSAIEELLAKKATGSLH